MALGKQWMAATGKSGKSIKAGGMARPVIITAIAQLIMASMPCEILGHFGAEQITI